MISTEEIKRLGIVGGGGAGFPAYLKLAAKAKTLIVNAAECEPLLHKDKEILKNYPQIFLEGLKTALALSGAKQAFIAVKKKYSELTRALSPLPSSVDFYFLDDFYPSGDEFVLVYEVTGKVIPPGKIPLTVGVLVQNVETLYNLGKVAPVTSKFLTVAGELALPATFEVPVGISLRELLYGSGVKEPENYFILLGGVMMGTPAPSLEFPVGKTLGGVILLSPEHPLTLRYRKSQKAMDRIGKSACDQCCFCTELCPRYLLGHPVIPHLVMRDLQFGKTDQPSPYALYCSECHLCSLVACPEDLYPKSACAFNKKIPRSGQLNLASEFKPHPLHKERRAPLNRVFAKLKLSQFKNEAPLKAFPLVPQRVAIPLKQHIGVAAVPVVQVGDLVKPGDTIARIPPEQLGADIHASIAGQVIQLGEQIIIEKR